MAGCIPLTPRVLPRHLQERDQELMTDLLVQLATSGVAKSEDYLEGMREYCSGLEDLALDVPQAPVSSSTCKMLAAN